jgi:hypothetical protein
MLSGGGNGSICVRHGNRLPCWTRKCVSVSGLEVSGVHKFRRHLSGGGNLHGHAFPCETQKRVTVLDMVVHSITCHQIDGDGRPCRELSPCRCQAAAAAIHAAAKRPPPLHCHAVATASKLLPPQSCCRPAAANDTTTVPSRCHSTLLTPRPWQRNCSASTPPPHSHSRGNQTSLCTSVLAAAADAIAQASKGQVMMPRHHCLPCRRCHCATLFAPPPSLPLRGQARDRC